METDQKEIDRIVKVPGEYREFTFTRDVQRKWDKNPTRTRTFINIDVYTKELHSVIGKGTQCYKELITWTFQKSILGTKIRSSIKEDKALSSFECMLMANTKRCGDNLELLR